MSTYLWDFISFLFPTVLALILFYIFGLSQFIGNGCLVTTIIIFLSYGLAIASSTYCLTFFFSDHTVAQNVILLLHFLSGLILMVLSFIMGLIEATKSANLVLKTIESSAREFVGKNNFSTLVATVNFVDLAGSERASQALTAGSRLKEGCHINGSLLTLGTIIRKLSKGRNGHVPYRRIWLYRQCRG